MMVDKKIRVLYIIPLVKIGGAEVVFESLDELEKYNIEIIKVDLNISQNSIFYYCNAFITIFKLFRYQNFDFVISSLWKSHLILFLLSFFYKINLIPFIHSSKFFSKYDSFFSKWILKKSFAVIVDSRSVLESVTKYVSHDNLFIVSMRTSKIVEKKIYEGFNQNLRFIFIGRVTASKRLDKSLNFLKQLKVKLPSYNISLDIFGPIEDQYAYENLMNSLDKSNLIVNFCGSIDNKSVLGLLIKYDFYLQFSDIEGLSVSVMDAMSVGLISIITNVGEIGNYAIDNFNSLLIEREDKVDLAVNKFNSLLMESENIFRISENAFKTFQASNLFKDDIFLVLKKISKCVK